MSQDSQRQSMTRRKPDLPAHGPGGMLGRPVEKAKDFSGTLKRLGGYLRPHTLAIAIVFVLTVASNIFMIFSPRILGEATNLLFAGEMSLLNKTPGAGVDFNGLLYYLQILLILYVFSALFGYFQGYIIGVVSQKIVYDLRRSVFAKLNRLPLKYYDGHAHGDILSRVTNDVDTISNTINQSLSQLIGAFVTLVGVIIMMFILNIWLALITLVVLPLSFLITRMVATRSQGYFILQQRTLGQLNGHVEEMFTGHKVVKAFGYEGESLARFRVINSELYDSGWKAQFVSGLLMPMLGMANNIGYVLVCVAGGLFVTQGMLQVGDVQAFLQYSRQFSQPINQVATIVNVVQSAVAAAERVFEMLDETEQVPEASQPRTLSRPRGEIRFEEVDFSYSPESELIRGLNMEAEQGKTIAIVGPTGAGKTTLVNLMLRFYEIQGGTIRFDGVDIRDLSRSELRRQFGMVLQDTWLFKGTIRENIAYGADNPSVEEVEEASRAARVDHFIRTLPDGYDTVLNEEASNISQGQKQLLTIARALLAKPTVLILDEATSSVDTRTEVLIQHVMAEMMRSRTAFVIAHRLSTIRDADLILVMNEGAIIETGTHHSLLEQKGFYADLYNSQFTSARLNGNGVPV